VLGLGKRLRGGVHKLKDEFQLLKAKEKTNIAKELRQVETNIAGITEATGNEQTAQQSCRHKHDQCGCLCSTGKVTLLTMLIFSLASWFYPLREMSE
jgi:hypothetical protein